MHLIHPTKTLLCINNIQLGNHFWSQFGTRIIKRPQIGLIILTRNKTTANTGWVISSVWMIYTYISQFPMAVLKHAAMSLCNPSMGKQALAPKSFSSTQWKDLETHGPWEGCPLRALLIFHVFVKHQVLLNYLLWSTLSSRFTLSLVIFFYYVVFTT